MTIFNNKIVEKKIAPVVGGLQDVSDNIGGTDSHSGKLNRDTSDGLVIHFVHIPTGKTCHFKAFLTAYEDHYDPQWNEEELFGRMDPVSTFKRTGRRITLGWDVPAASEQEAILNMKESEKFLAMLYPVYEERSAANFLEGGSLGAVTSPSANHRMIGTMAAPPLFKIKFANLIMDGDTGAVSSGASRSGLVGTMSGLSYKPDIEQGFFGAGAGLIEPGALIPQTIIFNIEFVVHHQHGLGFSKKSLEREKSLQVANARGNKLTGRRANGFPYRGDKILK